jgi:hypothetical protein
MRNELTVLILFHLQFESLFFLSAAIRVVMRRDEDRSIGEKTHTQELFTWE